MSRFEIKTPVPNYTGRVAGVTFADGRAVITSDTEAGLSALNYFKAQGYGIAALDREGVDEVLTRANEDPAAEHARLSAEIESKKQRLDLDNLRRQNEDLDAKLFKAHEASGDGEVQAGEGATTQPPLTAPPADSASVTEWRKWAVDSGRATPEQAKTMDRAAIQAEHGAAYDRERAARLQADAANAEVNG